MLKSCGIEKQAVFLNGPKKWNEANGQKSQEGRFDSI
jgi:hypothetical protein